MWKHTQQTEKYKQQQSTKCLYFQREANELNIYECTVATSHGKRHLKLYLIKLNDREACQKVYS
jgi:hypothetical protein